MCLLVLGGTLGVGHPPSFHPPPPPPRKGLRRRRGSDLPFPPIPNTSGDDWHETERFEDNPGSVTSKGCQELGNDICWRAFPGGGGARVGSASEGPPPSVASSVLRDPPPPPCPPPRGPPGGPGADPEVEVANQVAVLNELHRACARARFPKGVMDESGGGGGEWIPRESFIRICKPFTLFFRSLRKCDSELSEKQRSFRKNHFWYYSFRTFQRSPKP